jgi:hypothetical protein
MTLTTNIVFAINPQPEYGSTDCGLGIGFLAWLYFNRS